MTNGNGICPITGKVNPNGWVIPHPDIVKQLADQVGVTPEQLMSSTPQEMWERRAQESLDLHAAQSLFDPIPWGWEDMYRVGDRVQLVKFDPNRHVPIGAIGTIVAIEHEGLMADKGKPLEIDFDLSEYDLEFEPALVAIIKDRFPDFNLAERQHKATVSYSPVMVSKVE